MNKPLSRRTKSMTVVALLALLACGSTAAEYVPVKMNSKEARKLQADWATKLEVKVETKTSGGIVMVLIPPAGAALPKPYWLGKYEVTQAEWEGVMGHNPSGFKKGNKEAEGLDTSRFPVERVSWYDCLEFCNKLSEKERLPPYYELKVVKRSTERGIERAEVKLLGGNGYHLPTEIQWEHGCRAGTTTDFCFGDNEDGLNDYGWFDKNSGMRPHQVGEKKPNAFGLHDMHGNLREWVVETLSRDDFSALHSDRAVIPGRGMNLGGGFDYKASICKSNISRRHGPADRLGFAGFRLARLIPTEEEPSPTDTPRAKPPAGVRAAYALMVQGAELEAIVKATGIEKHTHTDLYFGTWHGLVGGTVESIQERHRAPIAKGDIDVLLVATWSWFPQQEGWHNRVGLDSALAGLAELGLKNNPNFRVCWRSYLQPQTVRKIQGHDPRLRRHSKGAGRKVRGARETRRCHQQEARQGSRQHRPARRSGVKVGRSRRGRQVPRRHRPGRPLWMKEESFNMNAHLHLRTLSAYCDYVALYRTSPVGLKPSFKGLTYNSKGGRPHSMDGITAEQHAILQRIAWETVSNYRHSGVKGTKQ